MNIKKYMNKNINLNKITYLNGNRFKIKYYNIMVTDFN